MAHRHLKIALDYDRTFTEDKELWMLFTYAALQRGHEVTFVTFRHGDEFAMRNRDIEEDAKKLGIKIVYSGYQPKRTVYNADIWIDDMPELISEFSPFQSVVKV